MTENENPSDGGITIFPSELDTPRDLRYIRKSFDKGQSETNQE